MTGLRTQLRPGRGLSLEQTLAGQALSAFPSTTPSHPWKTRPAWNALSRQWVATVEPGFVNEATPIYRTTLAEQKAIDENWGINPLSGEPYFSADVFERKTVNTGARRVDIPLYLNPAMPLSLRAIGFDGSPGYPVPEFFRDLGVAEAPKLPTPGTNIDEIKPPDLSVPRRLRLLRACDFLVHQPRSALTSTISIEPGIATGISNVRQTLSTRPAAAGDQLRIFAGVATARTPQTIDALSGDYEEQTFDEIHVSTVYLLSPPDTAPGSAPDLSWQPFVRHNLFWNLCHGQPAFQPLPGDPGVPFIPPLAGGAAQILINFLTASINDATTQALNILLGHSMAGRFWTATGGGRDATVLDTAEPAPPKGLNKAAILRDRAAAALRQQRAKRLDPLFPYKAEPFDLSLLRSN